MNRDIAGAEIAVLGSCLIDPQAYWRVADMIDGADFGKPENRELWEVIAELRKAGKDADAVTVGELNPGLASFAFSVASSSFSSATVRGYAEWILADAVQRRVNSAGLRISKLAGKDSIGEAQRILGTCQPRAMSAVRSIREFARDSMHVMQERVDATELLTGVPTSIEWLDEQTSGWQRGDLIILAARPSVGKTAFAIQCALAAATQGIPVFFASLEQSGIQIAERALSHLSHVSMQHIMQPKRIDSDAGEWDRITNASQALSKMPMMIDETGALTAEAISARTRQVNAEKRLGLIVIDYLTQITPPRADKTADAIQIITRTLKALAKELAVPIMLLSQLNRDGAGKPQLVHLRDSGAIEQDADVVAFLHRPNESQRDLIELTIAKQRNGPVDSTFMRADMDKMRFTLTDERPEKQTVSRGFGSNRDQDAMPHEWKR